MEIITKILKLDYIDDRRRKHILYGMPCKLGTMPAYLWFVDKVPEVDEVCYYFDDSEVSPKASNFNCIYYGHMHMGFCDRVNPDGYRFISK